VIMAKALPIIVAAIFMALLLFGRIEGWPF